jgi:hypothetical protein
MTEWIQWAEKLQAPGLIVSAGLNVMLYLLLVRVLKMLVDRDASLTQFATEMNESGKTLAKLAALLDLVCAKWLGGK